MGVLAGDNPWAREPWHQVGVWEADHRAAELAAAAEVVEVVKMVRNGVIPENIYREGAQMWAFRKARSEEGEVPVHQVSADPSSNQVKEKPYGPGQNIVEGVWRFVLCSD